MAQTTASHPSGDTSAGVGDIMRARNKIIGDAVLGLVERTIRGRGFEVTNHDSNPWLHPGDLVISNGNGRRLFAEVKGCRTLVRFGRKKPDRRYPGRPHLTSSRHGWLAEEGGVYIFAIYDLKDDTPEIVDLRWCRPDDVDPPSESEHYLIPANTVRSFPVLRHEDLVRLVNNAPEALA